MRNVVSWKPLVLGASFLLYGAGTAFATETDYLYPTSSTGLMSVQQDGRQVNCTIVDKSGPILGANVVVKGTTIGNISDMDGRAIIDNVPANAVLVVSYIGYVTQEVHLKDNQTSIKITLVEDSQALDEVVVTGYSTQAKKDITGSVAVVSTDDLKETPVSNFAEALQGKAAGVYVGASGAPGSQTMVRIRGINTINDNGPLYVIDGVSTRNQDLSSLNPNDIESMQVLKDASSAAIYGAQAANGVILITTKKGTKSGQPKLTYDGYVGVQKTGKKYDVLNSMDRLNLEWAAKANNYALLGSDEKPSHVQFGTGDKPIIPNYMTQAGAGGRQDIDPNSYSYPDNTLAPFSDTDWWDEIDRPAMMQNHQISLAGGTEKGIFIHGQRKELII